jgi:hypothetical protein
MIGIFFSVKVVNIFFMPRPLTDISVLKSDDYTEKWQKCGTLNLAKGATRFTASLSRPIVAANLKIEFTEFYERPGESSRSSDGSLLIHCPRCTRIVNNQMGVCASCGEVAFQCRKCRHIVSFFSCPPPPLFSTPITYVSFGEFLPWTTKNYDRLDAFICKEW